MLFLLSSVSLSFSEDAGRWVLVPEEAAVL